MFKTTETTWKTEWAWSHSEWLSMANHLRVAAARYDSDAQVTVTMPRLRDQFMAQAKQARAMAAAIEERIEGVDDGS